jgi:hypothetical protein
METNQFIIGLNITAWDVRLAQVNKQLEKLGPASAAKEITTGGNPVVYILGHLVAVHDNMVEGMNFGARSYPELDGHFLKPYQPETAYATFEELMVKWHAVNARLKEGMSGLTVDGWLARHHYVSEADFAKEPHRCVLNLLISRTMHLAHHSGQLALVK